MSDVLLQIEDLRVEYAGVPAVHEASIAVEHGQVVALVGANGAGKSSVLRAVSGVVTPAGGDVRLDGESILRKPAHDIMTLGIAHVPEGRRLFGALTVEENLRLGAYPVDDKQEVVARLEEVHELFPVLGQRHRQRCETLSGGEQQMVAVARGLMSRPRLLLLDEPSLGVMPTVVERLYDLVGQLTQRGVSVLIADQNLEQLLALADHAYVLQTGRVVMQGPGGQLLAADEVRQAYLGI